MTVYTDALYTFVNTDIYGVEMISYMCRLRTS